MMSCFLFPGSRYFYNFDPDSGERSSRFAQPDLTRAACSRTRQAATRPAAQLGRLGTPGPALVAIIGKCGPFASSQEAIDWPDSQGRG